MIVPSQIRLLLLADSVIAASDAVITSAVAAAPGQSVPFIEPTTYTSTDVDVVAVKAGVTTLTLTNVSTTLLEVDVVTAAAPAAAVAVVFLLAKLEKLLADADDVFVKFKAIIRLYLKLSLLLA
jgi:hypothetical protein